MVRFAPLKDDLVRQLLPPHRKASRPSCSIASCGYRTAAQASARLGRRIAVAISPTAAASVCDAEGGQRGAIAKLCRICRGSGQGNGIAACAARQVLQLLIASFNDSLRLQVGRQHDPQEPADLPYLQAPG